ncbi:MAG: hypothetical protein DMG49_12315 [Acidobacteria bacterium]|nr:MAG: hypothetical protein DMG49_12315 [Acidobacteriota bacterium]
MTNDLIRSERPDRSPGNLEVNAALPDSWITQSALNFTFRLPVVTENSVRSENKEVPINREIMVATTMALFSSPFLLW